jgi:hypothetical protein
MTQSAEGSGLSQLWSGSTIGIATRGVLRIGHRIAFDFMPPLLSLPVIHRATIPLSEELSAGSARRFADATSPV